MTTMACYINSLPDEILEYILNLIPPYKDLTLCTVVCKRWYHAVKRMNPFFFITIFIYNINFETAKQKKQ